MDRCFLLTLVAAAGLAGCDGASVVLDGGLPSDAMVTPGQLTIVSEVPIGLTFADEAELVVRLTQAGRPAAGETVRFAFEGTAHDSSLSALSVTTDGDGLARTRLRAGTVPAVFRLRAISDGASAVYAEVSVSGAGFGGLVVEADYQGERGPVMRRVLSVYPGTVCDPPDGYPRFPARMAILDADGPIEATWSTLSAGIPYAVVGVVEGPTGVELARGCVDEVMVEAGRDQRASLSFLDAALLPAGYYETDLVLSPGDAAVIVGTRVLETTGAAVAGVSLYLDALEAWLRAAGDDATADALAAARVDLADGLSDALDLATEGVQVAVAAFIDRFTARVAALHVRATLDMTSNRAMATGLLVPTEVVLGTADPDGLPPLPLDIDPPSRVTWTFARSADMDSLRVDDGAIGLALGQVAVAALEVEAGGDDLGMALLPGAGCDVFVEFVTSDATLDACDESCAMAACVTALDVLAAQIVADLARLDSSRTELRVSGPIRATDDDGDLTVDRLEAEALDLLWKGPGDPIGGEGTAVWSAARVER